MKDPFYNSTKESEEYYTLLREYITAPELDSTNFKLGVWYQSKGHTASAVSFYIRAAERTSDTLVQYECMLRASSCFHEQGSRGNSVKGLLQHAVALLPDRPEAYFFLSRYYEQSKEWFDGYTIASIGATLEDKHPPLSSDIGYPGSYGNIFEKAVTAWWCGLNQESVELFKDLYLNYPLDKIHKDAVVRNLKSLNVWNEVNTVSGTYWRSTPFPTLEITTSIPTQGCVVDCAFCPQRVLIESYKGVKKLSFEKYKEIIDKLPKEVRITFAGFTEPWLHKECTNMLLYAHEQGHPVSVFTTGIGMKEEDVERLKDIPYFGDPNGGFVLHLPDQEMIAKHPITDRYLKVLDRFAEYAGEIQNFRLMSMGELHEKVKDIFPQPGESAMWSRAGNLNREVILKPELLNLTDRFRSIYHGEEPHTCGCDERLYHNVLLPNGDVSLCCMDYGLEQILGNLFESEYDEIMPKPFSCFDLCNYCENAVKPEIIKDIPIL